MELAAELEASLREFAATAPVEVRENGGRMVAFGGLSWEVRGTAEKPLLHLWSAEYNLTRRVLAITDHSEECLTLAVERFGSSKPDRLEFVRVNFDRSAREITRRAFCEQLRRILAEQFPDEIAESLTISADLEHSLSGNYARGVLRRGSVHWAVLGVADGESADALRFHPATDELLRHLSPEVELVRVGLAESWRRGVRVVMRQEHKHSQVSELLRPVTNDSACPPTRHR